MAFSIFCFVGHGFVGQFRRTSMLYNHRAMCQEPKVA